MKKIFVILLTLISINVFGQDSIPESNPDTWVVDDANVLNRDEEISEKLLQWEQQYNTGVQYAVVTVKSLEGYDVSSYATEIGYRWGVGKRGSNNGIVILIAPNEHKIWVATGYGAEAIITDADASRLCNIAYPTEELKAGEFDNGTLKLIDLIHDKVGKMSEIERENWRMQEEEARILEQQRRSEELTENTEYFFMYLFLIAILGFIVYKIVKAIQIKNEYRKIKSKINIDIDAIRKSNKTIPYNETDLIKELIVDTNSLEEAVKKSNPLKITHIAQQTSELKDKYTEVANKYNKICSLIDTKHRMEVDVNNMIDFLSKWTTHPNVLPMLNNLQSMVGNIKLNIAIPYSYDNIKTRYNEVKNDINVRLDIESGMDLSKYIKINDKAKIISRDLALNFIGSDVIIEESKTILSKIDNYKNNGDLEKNWTVVREMWLSTVKKLNDYYTKANNILTIETDYKTALKNIPSKASDIACTVIDCSNKITNSGVSSMTKTCYENFLTKWEKTRKNADGLATLDAIKLSSTLYTLHNDIKEILNKIEKDHKKYVASQQQNTSSTYSYSNNNSGGNYGGGGSYGGGSFGGGGSGKSWN